MIYIVLEDIECKDFKYISVFLTVSGANYL